MLKSVYEDSSLNYAGSALQENEKYLDSIEGKTQQFQNAWQSLQTSLVNSEGIKTAIDGAKGLLNVLNGLVDLTGGTSALAMLGAGLASVLGNHGLFKTGEVDGTLTQIMPFGSNKNGSILGNLNPFSGWLSEGMGGRKLVSQDDYKMLVKFNEEIARTKDGTLAMNATFGETDSVAANLARKAANAKTASEGVGVALSKVTTTSKAAAFGMKALNVAMNVGAMLAVSLALKVVSKGLDYLANRFSNTNKKAQESAEAYQSAQQELTNLNSQYDENAKTIEEYQKLATDGSINPSQQVELENLKAQNEELERKKELQEDIVADAQTTSAKEAAEAMDKGMTNIEYQKNGGKANTFGMASEYDGKSVAHSLPDLIKANIDAYNNASQQLEENIDTWSEEEIERNKEAMDDYKSFAVQNAETIQSWIDSMTDENGYILKDSNGEIIEDYAERVEVLRNLLTDISNIGLGRTEKTFNTLDNFFSDAKNSAIKTMLQQASAEGENLEEVLASVGLYVRDLGDDVTTVDLVEYFRQASESATSSTSAFNLFQKSIKNLSNGVGSISSVDKFASKLGFTIKNLSSAFPALASNMDNVHFREDMYKAIANNSNLAFNSIEDLKSVYPDLGAAIESANGNVDIFTQSLKSMVEAANEFSNNMSIADITAAMETHNQGADYEKLAEYLKTAKQLYDEGRTGTDDFRSVAELISKGDSNSSASQFAKDYKKLQKYFIYNNDDILQSDGVVNLLEDLSAAGKKLGKTWAECADDGKTWSVDLDSTAEAADELGISVQVLEAMLGKLDEYDNLGVFNWTSSLDQLNAAKDAYSSLLELQQQSDDDDYHSIRFQANMDEWNRQIAQAEGDLNNLPPDVVVQMQFEYSLEQLRQKAKEAAAAVASGTGNTDTSDHAQAIATADTYIEQLLSGINFDNFSTNPLQSLLDARTSAKSAVDTAVLTGKENEAIVPLQVKVENLNSEISTVLQAFYDAHPEITPETDTSTAEATWNEWVKTEEGSSLMASIDLDGNTDGLDNAIKEAKEKLETVQNKVVELNGDDNASDIISMWNHLQAEDKFTTLSAEDQATVLINLWNNMNPEDKEAYLTAQDQGTWLIEYWNNLSPETQTAILTVTDNTAEGAASVEANKEEASKDPDPINFTAIDNGATETANKVATAVKSIPSSKNITITTTKKTVETKETAKPGVLGGTLGGHNYLNGTNYQSGIVNGHTANTVTALVGEEGRELVATRKNGWYTVGDDGASFETIPKGSVVFNAKQTKELLSKGSIKGRGINLLSGTNFNNGGSVKVTRHNNAASNSTTRKSSGSSSSSKSSNSSSSSSGSSSSSSSSSDSSSDTPSEQEFDWIEVAIDRVERKIDNLSKTTKNSYKTWSKRNSSLLSQMQEITNEINIQNAGYNKYMELANSVGLSADWAAKVQSGAIDYSTITDEDLSDKIQKYTTFYEKAIACSDAVIDLQNDLSDLAKTKFDNVQTQFEEIIDDIEHIVDLTEAYIDLNEEQGYISSTEYYNQLITLESNNILKLCDEYDALIAARNEAVNSGRIEKESEAWFEMNDAIQEVESSILDAQKALVEYKNSLREVGWDVFEKQEDYISEITTEADFLIDLLSDRNLVDENGSFNNLGKSVMGLHAVNYDTYMQQADDYARHMKEVQKELDNDRYNTTLIEKRNELLKLQQESIANAEDEKQAIKDLVSDAYDGMLDALQDLIDKRKEYLQGEQDIYNYQKNVSSITDQISSYQKQLMALSGDDSEENRAQVQTIKENLKNSQDELEQTEYEQWLSDQEQLMDDMYDQMEEWLNTRLDDIDARVLEMIDYVNANADTINTTISEETALVGYNITDAMNTIWTENKDVVSYYNENLYNALYANGNANVNAINLMSNNVVTAINSVKNLVQQMVDAANKKAEEEARKAREAQVAAAARAAATKSSGSSSSSNSNKSSGSGSASSGNGSNGGWGSWFINKVDSYPKQKLRTDVSIVDRLKFNNFDSSMSARRQYYYAMGGTGNYTGTAAQNVWMIQQMKQHGYKDGGTIGSAIKKTGEDGFILARTGEEVLSLEKVSALRDAMKYMNPIIEGINNGITTAKNISTNNNNSTLELHLDNINISDINDPQEFATNLVDSIKNNRQVQRTFTDLTSNTLLGKNSLNVRR